jgi:hypothetical protein
LAAQCSFNDVSRSMIFHRSVFGTEMNLKLRKGQEICTTKGQKVIQVCIRKKIHQFGSLNKFGDAP